MANKKANNNPSDNMNDGLIEALNEFQREYPNTTSGDLQTFIMGARAGWMAAMESMDNMSEMDTGGGIRVNSVGE